LTDECWLQKGSDENPKRPAGDNLQARRRCDTVVLSGVVFGGFFNRLSQESRMSHLVQRFALAACAVLLGACATPPTEPVVSSPAPVPELKPGA
jgi:hypothetical protein